MSVTGATVQDDDAFVAYVNGSVVTVDDDFSVQEAFSVHRGRLHAVGSTDDVLAGVPSEAEVVDLGGAVVLPGFIDAHAHTVLRAIGGMATPSLAGLGSVAEILETIERAAAGAHDGQWIVTSPIGEPPDHFNVPASLDEGRWPTRDELDQAAPHNPVYIPTPIAWPNPSLFNSSALAELGVRGGANEGGVWCEVDETTGELTSVVHGMSLYNRHAPAVQLLQEKTPKPGPEAVESAIGEAMRDNMAVGVTSIYEGHLNSHVGELESLRRTGRLSNRVVCTYEVSGSDAIDAIDQWMAGLDDAKGAGSGDELLKVLGVTISLDGAIQFGKALMREPYLDPYGQTNNGATSVSQDKLTAIADLAVKHGLRLNILAAGSGAIDITMQSLREVHSRTPLTGRRWVVQHFQHPTQSQIAELAEMGLVAQTYASVDFSKGAEVYRNRLSSDIWQSVVPLRWWIDGGMVIAQGSDGSHYNPLFQIWESLRRLDGRTGESVLAEPKKVTREEAIATYTINGAIVMQCEDSVGSLEAGKLADFVLLDRNLLTCGVDEIRTANVVGTVLGGKVLYDPQGLLGRGEITEPVVP